MISISKENKEKFAREILISISKGDDKEIRKRRSKNKWLDVMFQNATAIWDRKREYATRVEPRAGWQRFGGLGYLARRHIARVAEFLTSANSSTISCSSRAPWSLASAILKFPFRSFAIAVSIQPRDGLQIPADGLPVWTAQPATQSSQHLGRWNLQADGNEPVPSCGAQG